MPGELKILLVGFAIIFLVFLFFELIRKKITTSHAIMWFLLDILIIVFTLTVSYLEKIANFVGIKTVSNMLFFGAFVLVFLILYNIYRKLSSQNQKIIKLTQDLAIIERKIRDEKKKHN